MRLTPAQIAVRLICGARLPRFRPSKDDSLIGRVQEGRALLVEITGMDFGYDLQAWHDHLKESRQGGYTYGRNVSLPRLMKGALESAEWQEAVRSLPGVHADLTRRRATVPPRER
jgi:hypothetical protein